jgi:2'-5' RNA ligase
VAEGLDRLFVAVPIAPHAAEACRALIDEVRTGPAGRGPRWVRSENLHLTLRFLGEVERSRSGEVEEAVAQAADGRAPFDVVLSGAGAFPDAVRPRALWLGLERGRDELQALVSALDAPLARLGWPPETRPYRPHMTVARTDAPPRSAAIAAAAALVAAARDWRVAFRAERVVLYRSHLGSGGPRYESVSEVVLRA